MTSGCPAWTWCRARYADAGAAREAQAFWREKLVELKELLES